ncbi:PTS sugar transporter subunit IIB [uncultured Agrococcus sp.]|uniref:PTS sugar transporter subunit IIB n=1 Tax=uncultured Agrococcus sp. TaxID=382258 RepID=UPI0025DAD2C9|nr:PTS sugar transporter subunit IIB [uncultured Agrococcus sp.]
MRIVAVCGMGIGTSVLLKMNIEKALDELGVDGVVDAADITAAKGVAQGADLVVTSEELLSQLESLPVDVVAVKNFMDLAEITDTLDEYV